MRTIRTKAPLRAVPKDPAPQRREKHLQRVRELPCCVCSAPPPSDPHHYGRRGVGQKADDYQTVPLCRRCHDGWHAQGYCPPYNRSETVETFLRAQVAILMDALARASDDSTQSCASCAEAARERDAARAEVERLRARVRSVDHSTAYEGKAFDDSPSSQEDLAIVASERDEARAEVERLRAEVERLRREHDHERTVANEQLARAHDAVRERDEAREECAELREYAETVGLRAVTDASETYKVVVGERDIAEAEVEQLRAEVERLRRERAECFAERKPK